MKIAVWQNLPSGGGKRALHDHVRGLVGRGHSVESWSPPEADRSYMALGPYCEEHIVAWDREKPVPRGRIGRWLHPVQEAVFRIEAMHRHARQCAEAIDAGGFDVVFANTCQYHAAPAIARYATTPAVLYLQEPNREFYEARPFWDQKRLFWVPPSPPPLTMSKRWPPGLRGLNRVRRSLLSTMNELVDVQSIRLLAREEYANARSFHSILCNSLFSREAFIRAYGLETRVCSLGIDADSFVVSEQKLPYVVGVGSFLPSKGIEHALRGLSRIAAHSRPTLVWIGNMSFPGHLEELTALARDLGVRFEPRLLVSQEELVATLGRAAVMVYTSKLEPFGYAPLEANACGTVVVGVAEGGIRETIVSGINGVLVDLSDVDALGRAVQVYVEDLALAREHGLRARRHVVEHLGLAGAIDQIEEALDRACCRAIAYSDGVI